MGERIEEGYREKLRTLLARVQPRRLEFGVELLMGRARDLARSEGLSVPQALARVYEFTRVRVEKRVKLMAACSLNPAAPAAEPRRFLCDANLGGLARWLRAAGYEAGWRAGIDDGELVAQAHAEGALLLTGDVGIMRRRLVRGGAVHALWVPSSLGLLEQLSMVMRELGLALRSPRCMACGGALKPVAKDEVESRIPPRTARWKDAYFLCAACGRLFWEGTHWERITARLARAVAPLIPLVFLLP